MKTTEVLMKTSRYSINNLEVKIVVKKAICHNHRLDNVSIVGDDRLHFLAGQARERGGIPAF